MTRTAVYAPAVGPLSLAVLRARGTSMAQCAATGAVAGLVVAGPVRAAVGGAVGVVVNEVEEDKE